MKVNGRKVLIMFALCIVLICLVGLPCQAQTIKWKLVGYGVSGSWFYNETAPRFAEMVKNMSGGRLVIQTFPVGVLVGSAEIFEAVSKGTIDAAIECPPYHSGILPMAYMEWGYPGTWNSLEEFTLLHDFFGFSDIQRKAYASRNIHFLDAMCGGGISLISKKPVRTLADFKGMKIRAIGGMADVLKRAGAAITWVPGPEIYTALATGVIDGAVYGNISDVDDLKLQEVAKYWITPNLQEAQGADVYLVNMKRWKELPDDLKSIVATAARAMRDRHFMRNFHDGQKILSDWKGKFGVQTTSLSEKDREQLRKFAVEEMQNLAEKDPKYAAEMVKKVKDMWDYLGRK